MVTAAREKLCHGSELVLDRYVVSFTVSQVRKDIPTLQLPPTSGGYCATFVEHMYQVQRVPQATAGDGANHRCRLASGASLLGNEGRLSGGTEVYNKSASTTGGRGTKTETPSRIV